MGKRNLSLERQWRGRVKKYEKSGLTIREFCEQQDLVSHQLTWWRRELKRRNGGARRGRKKTQPTKRAKRSAAVDAGFIPVHVSGTCPPASIEIVLDEPLRIAVRPGFDGQLLADVLRALEQRGC